MLKKKDQIIIARNGDTEVRRLLANNPNLCEKVQVTLASDDDVYVRRHLAGNLNLCKQVQVTLQSHARRFRVCAGHVCRCLTIKPQPQNSICCAFKYFS